MLLVLGPHRSGTSLVARMLECLGAKNSVNLLPAQPDNPKGFFEDADIVRFNEDQLLPALGVDWFNLQPIDWSRLNESKRSKLVLRAIELLRSNYPTEQGLSVLKEPRISSLLPFWLPALRQAGFETRAVCTVRDPLSVARSLEKRNGLTLAHAGALYAVTWSAIVNSLKSNQVAFVVFDDIFKDAQAVLATIAKSISLELPGDFKEHVEAFKEGHLDRSLRHSSVPFSELALEPELPPIAIEVYRSLISNSQSGDVHKTFHRLAGRLQCFRQLSPLVEQYDRILGEHHKIAASLQEFSARLTALETEKNFLAASLRAEQRTLQETKDSAALVRQDFSARLTAIETEKNSLAASLQGKERELADLRGSTCWKLTWPLRKLGTPLRPLTDRIKRYYLARTAGTSTGHVRSGFAEPSEYKEWIKHEEMRSVAAMGSPAGRPLISVLLPVYQVREEFLRRAIESVSCQSYDNWELCIANGFAEDATNSALIESFAKRDPRIRVEICKNAGISANTNRALAMARGEFIALLDHDDELAPFALADMARAIQANPDVDFLYSDKDSIDEDSSTRRNALFKPMWSPETMFSVNYVTHLNLTRRTLAEKVGGFRSETDGAQDWDFFMRVTEQARSIVRVPGVHYHWRIHARSTSTGVAAKPYALDAQLQTIRDAARRRGMKCKVQPNEDSGFHLEWSETGNVLIIVDAFAANTLETVHRVLTTATATRVTVLVDSKKRSKYGEPPAGVKIVECEESFDRTRLIDGLCRELANEVDAIVFLSGHVAQLSEGWLRELSGWVGNSPELGFASSLVLDNAGLVIEAGMVTDAFGNGSALFRSSPLRQWGWLGGPLWYRNCTACSPWAAAVNPRALLQAGGFDHELDWPEAFIKACRAMHAAGFRGLVNPHSRARLAPNALVPPLPAFHETVAEDPYFHPAFSSVSPLRLKQGPRISFEDVKPLAQSDYSLEAAVLASCCKAEPGDLAKQQQHPRRVGRGKGAGWCNWLMPPIENPAYGGAMTIIRFADFMSRTRGTNQRFLFLGDTDILRTRSRFAELFPGLSHSEYFAITAPEHVPPADYAFATLWTTAYTLLKVRNAGLKFYFVQDYEPLFYPAGSTQAMAALTYDMGFYAVTNTEPLRRIHETDHSGRAVHFVPQIDTSVFHPAGRSRAKLVKKIFFYGRPGHPRNGFEVAAEALRILKAELGEAVEIVCAGSRFSPGDFHLDGVVTNLGLLSYKETAELYRNCDIGLVMMMTKHPSYLPLELMACGALLLTNRNPTNSWLLKDGDNCLLAEASAPAVAARLRFAVENLEGLESVRSRGTRMALTRFNDWDAAFEPVAKFIETLATEPNFSPPGLIAKNTSNL